MTLRETEGPAANTAHPAGLARHVRHLSGFIYINFLLSDAVVLKLQRQRTRGSDGVSQLANVSSYSLRACM